MEMTSSNKPRRGVRHITALWRQQSAASTLKYVCYNPNVCTRVSVQVEALQKHHSYSKENLAMASDLLYVEQTAG